MSRQKPAHLKAITGTYRGDRVKDIPTPSLTLPSAPEWLPDGAKAIFTRLVQRLKAIRCASDSYTETVALLAVRMHEIQELTGYLAEHGTSYDCVTKTGLIRRARVEVAMRSEAARQAQSLLAELGLTPTSTGRVTVSTSQEAPRNTFDDIDEPKGKTA
jgi:P27 family predicted phage terminase small subunit